MFVIGIAGGSGSGKTTLVRRLMSESPLIAHLPHDAYYRNDEALPSHLRKSRNWDHPDALDTDLLVKHIDRLKQGKSIKRPVYSMEISRREAKTILISPAPVLLVDGILVLAIREIRRRLDLKVYVDTPPDLRVLRRIERDEVDRNRGISGIVKQYLASVRPMHERFVEPSRRFAKLVVPWEEHNGEAVDVLLARMREHLPKQVRRS